MIGLRVRPTYVGIQVYERSAFAQTRSIGAMSVAASMKNCQSSAVPRPPVLRRLHESENSEIRNARIDARLRNGGIRSVARRAHGLGCRCFSGICVNGAHGYARVTLAGVE